MNLLELRDKIYKQNVKIGWHDEPRSFSMYKCLFHSELSEALEGDRKDLKDDHLPQYEMFWAELADYVIRVLDYFGSKNIEISTWKNLNKYNITKIELLDELHCSTSRSEPEFCVPLERAIHQCFDFAETNGVDLEKIILEKVEYNRTRADHQRENRAKDGGKKY